MPNSYAQSAQLACPVCGQPFAADIWLIVDVDERPDLAAHARAGDLHAVACPRCGPQGAVDAPLLLYLPRADPATGQPPLIFSPAQQTSAEQDQEMAGGLLGTLAQRLGAAWQDDWLAQVATVQRELLPVALSDDPAAAMRELREEIAGEEIEEELPPAVAAALEAVLRQLADEGVTVESPEDLERALANRPDLQVRLEAAMTKEDGAPADNLPGSSGASGKVDDDLPLALPDVLNQFLAAATWDESQRIVEAHPALLSDEADERFALALAEYADDPDAVKMLTTHRALLRRCREAGIARAFAEQMLPPEMLAEAERLGLAPEAFLAQMRAAEQMPPALREVLAELAAAGVEIHSPEDLERALAARPDLHAKLEAAAREISPNDNPGIFRDSGIVPGEDRAPTLPALLDRFVRLNTWDDAQRMVEDHPALLSDEADQMFAAVIDQAQARQDAGAVEHFTRLQAVLRRCREAGVARAFAEQMLNANGLAEAERLGMAPEEFLAQMRAAEQMPPALREVLGELAAAGVEIRSPEDLERALAARPDLAAKLAAMGEGDGPAVPPEFVDDLRRAQEGEQRYRRIGDLAGLDAAAAAWARILDAPGFTSATPRFRLAALNDAAIVFIRRYQARGQPRDLDRALAGWERAVAETPAGSPDLPSLLNNLGTGLRTRFGRTGRLEDLEEAIRVYRQAVAETPAGSPDLPSLLNNLGNGLSTRFGRTGRLEDLEEAIRVYRQAVAETPAGSPDLPGYLNNLGNGLSTRFGRTGRLEDLEEAIQRYRVTCELGAAAAPQEVLRAARNWGRWAMQRQAWAEVDEAYTHGLTTGRALHRRQVRRADKESWLADVQEMAPAAAYAQARLGDPVRAAVTLEAGRAQLLAEGLEQNRRDLDRLPSLGHGDLHARYLAALAARRRLEQPDAVVADRLAAITAADREFDAVVAAIRGVDGYADFFAEPTFARLQAAAQDGPLVYIAATAAGGLALIVRGQDHKPGFWEKPGLSAAAVTAVWLDDLTDARVREWLVGPEAAAGKLGGWLGAYQGWLQASQEAQRFSHLPRDDARRKAAEAAAAAAQTEWFATLDAVTAALWPVVLAPLTAILPNPPIPQSPNPSISNLQSPNLHSPLTLIPTGLLALLPLHAAWRADPSAPTGRRYFLDDYVVRYAPSATALGHAAQTAATAAAARLLAIDEPAVAGAGRLPNSAREVAAVAGHFTAPTLLAHAAATRAAVLARLADAQVAHFSCHGANDWGDPLASGLLMAGGERLTVADVLDLRLGGARLATLSACETGIPGADLPDEAVMLPSALLQAGYAGVAASLWTVSDISTAMLMAYFYKLWREDGIEPPAALVLAQRWLRDSSNGEKQAFFAGYAPELAGELKMGMAVAVEFFVAVRKQGLVEERSFAAPFHWAAFYYTGA